jgi:hypothetical protein
LVFRVQALAHGQEERQLTIARSLLSDVQKRMK